MSLNLEEFVSDSQAPTFTTETLLDSEIPVAQKSAESGESTEETTRKIFEKILQAKKVPPVQDKPNTPSHVQKQSKKKKARLAKQEEKERARLAKKQALKEQVEKEKQLEKEVLDKKKALLAAEKKKQEMLAMQKTQAQEQERLAQQKEKQSIEEVQKEMLAQKIEKINQEKRRREKAKREALKREKAQKKAKLAQKEADKKRKQKLRKEKLVAQKLAKQKLAKEKLLKKRALEKKLAKKRAAKKSTKGKTSKQDRSKYANSAMGKSTQEMIHAFYGDEFSHFTGTQQKFIEKNLGNIYVITQRVLSHKGYPFKAKQRHQQGVQLVTFYLHPNGRISKLKFLQRSKYKVLNDNTLKIIRFAHRKYPKPKTTTKITFFVVYTLQ